MSSPLLSFQHVSKFYKSVIGVGDINLEVEPGAYGLIGPNGAGKSTFIHLVMGVLKPSIGSLKVLGADPSREKQVLKKIGFCPSSEILFPNITAFQWVEHQTRMHGFTRSESEKRAKESLAQLGMKEKMHLPIGTFSLGMRQRTKLAQAVSHGPELLILDEPFNGLDPIGRLELTEFLLTWVQSDRSLILASHVLHEVEAITNQFLLIYGGRILASGNAPEVRSMLSEIPVEVKIAGSGLTHLAAELANQTWLTGLQFSADRSNLSVSVADQVSFQQFLQSAACDEKVNITAIDSPDSTLEGAFELLLRVHRGEV